MTIAIAIAPKAALAATAPTVGIFWLIEGSLLIDRSTLEAAEPYGECLTHTAGHYDRWQEWQALGVTRLAALGYPGQIVSSEYDEWPRGRVVHETQQGRFVLYADPRLQRPEIIEALKLAFGLDNAEVVVRSDAHYR